MTRQHFHFLLLAILFTVHGVSAQNEKDEYLKLIGGKDADFESTTYPASWDKESAVILAEKHTYTSTRVVSNDLTWRWQKRRRIVLLDKAAVEEFSYFYFQGETNKKTSHYNSHVEFDSLQILITKPNGTSKLVDLSKAVKVEKDISIPSIFRGSASEYYQKVAIPDLEPGDIIDYNIMKKYLIWIAMIPATFDFPAILYTLDNTYPTVKHKFSIEFPNTSKAMNVGYMTLYLNTYNGAPQVQKEVNGNVSRFFIEADNLKKDEYERWVYPFRVAPTVKGQVIYVKPRPGDDTKIKQYLLSPIPYDIKKTVTADELKDWSLTKLAFSNLDRNSGSGIWTYMYMNEALDYIKKYHGKETDPVVIAKAAYYCLRDIVLEHPYWRDNNIFFLHAMQYIFDKKKIPYTYIVVVPRRVSSLDNALLADEIDFMIKLPGAKPYYLYNVYRHASFGEILSSHEGNEAYEIDNFAGKKAVPTIKKVTIPMTTATENSTSHTSTYTIDEEFDTIKVESQVTIKGIPKDEYYSDLLIFADYEEYDAKRFRNPKFVGIKNRELKEDRRKKEDALYQEKVDARKEARKKNLEDDFQVESYDDLTLLQDGRTEDKQDVIFTEKYKITGLTKHVGNNYLFEAGKLIGGQVEIKEKELERQYDVYMDNARSFTYNITVNLPEDYTVKDVSKLNFNVSNETGSFKTVATVNGNVLTITMTKVYNHNFEKKIDWPKMVAFLDACYDFTQTKVLIVKK
ncbi:MAG: hypothetical protein JWO58_2242 [Chitinophagaceae bacterium]|nr:hypothetical protein [Chitinophagaceae bacterium]